MKFITSLFFALLFSSCINEIEIEYPVIDPAGLLEETEPLETESKIIMNGIYVVQEGTPLYGTEVVIKWSNSRLSVFSGNEGAYGVLNGGQLDSILYFEGYWRFPFSTSTGLLKLNISSDSGAASILNQDTASLNIVIEGVYGSGNEVPSQKIILKYLKPLMILPEEDEFEILAHRGGGRNSDLLGVSENSIPMIGKAEGLGATGVEVDVRMSVDGVLFLYHDDDINLRLTQKSPLWGRIENYSWPQIRSIITLLHGEKVPSLQEAMDFILDSTVLRTVWLDMKNPKGVPLAVAIQKEILERAALSNRDIKIYIGLPEESIVNAFKEIPDHRSIPSLCELEPEIVNEINSEVWGPKWTEGLQTEIVLQMQSENRKVFVWTLDQPAFIETFIKEGEFNGILSNFPPLIAYHHYINGSEDK